jgi:HK97 family phage prohead protease
MPWHLEGDHPDCSGWAVVKDSDNSVVGCHPTKAEAQKHLAALNINVEEKMTEKPLHETAPKDDLIRMVPMEQAELRTDGEGNGMTLSGYAAVFDDWAEIESMWEGNFRERFLPGAFKRTLSARGDKIKVLFNHGMDPSIGDKPLGKPDKLKEDKRGLYVEVPLDDTSYNRDLAASLRSGALDGMSIRFRVVKEDWDYKDERKNALAERTISEAQLYELGPVTFPAYEATTAGIRSAAAYTAWRANAGKLQEPVGTSEESELTSPDGEPEPTSDEPVDISALAAYRMQLTRRELEWKR